MSLSMLYYGLMKVEIDVTPSGYQHAFGKKRLVELFQTVLLSTKEVTEVRVNVKAITLLLSVPQDVELKQIEQIRSDIVASLQLVIDRVDAS